MQMFRKDLLPTKTLKSDAAIAAMLVLMLWASRHPVDEWAIAAAVIYVAMRLSGFVLGGLLACSTKMLAGYGERLAQKFNVQQHEFDAAKEQIAESASKIRLIFVAIVLLLMTGVFGVAIIAGNLAVSWLGLSTLSGYVQWMAWAFLAVGMVGLTLTIGVPMLILVRADISLRKGAANAPQTLSSAAGLAEQLAQQKFVGIAFPSR